jgi:hypothetical protein
VAFDPYPFPDPNFTTGSVFGGQVNDTEQEALEAAEAVISEFQAKSAES